MNRDAIVGTVYWNKWINYETMVIADDIKTIALPSGNPAYRPQYVKDLAFKNRNLMLRSYSRGDSVADLAQYIEPLLYYWELSERLGQDVWSPEQQRIRHTWSTNLDFYIDCFWAVGLALALEVPDDQWRRLLALVGNEGEDELLDRIIATRTCTRRVSTSLCYPKPYARLLKAIDSSPSAQPALLASFIDHWYEEVGRASRSGREKQAIPHKVPYWHGYHYPMKGAYFGYWCLEAVAAVKAFGLDDSKCVGHPNYPGDLLRPGHVTPPDMARLLPELAASIGQPPPKPFTGEPLQLTAWQTLKLLIKNKLDR